MQNTSESSSAAYSLHTALQSVKCTSELLCNYLYVLFVSEKSMQNARLNFDKFRHSSVIFNMNHPDTSVY